LPHDFASLVEVMLLLLRRQGNVSFSNIPWSLPETKLSRLRSLLT